MKRSNSASSAFLAVSLLVTVGCSSEPQDPSVEMSAENLISQVSLVPTSATTYSGISGKGCGAPYWTCVDDGTAYTKSDDGATVAQIDSASSGTHTLGFSGGPTGSVGQVTVSYRASLSTWSMSGTIQVLLYNGSTLLSTGTAHTLGSAWTNLSDTFTGLNVANVNTLRASVLLNRRSGSGQVRYTMLWLVATGVGYCAADADCSASTPKCNTTTHKCECLSGAKQCTGNQPQTCSSAGAWQNTGAACPYTCSAGTCSGVCSPGAVRCTGNQPQTCSTTGAWQNTGAACPYACSAGTCSGVCSPGAIQCMGNQPQTCSSTATWQNAGSVCNAGCINGTCLSPSVPCGTGTCSIANGGQCCATIPDPTVGGDNAHANYTCLSPTLSCTNSTNTASPIQCNGRTDCPADQVCCDKGYSFFYPGMWEARCMAPSSCVVPAFGFAYQLCDPSLSPSECLTGSCQQFQAGIPGIYACQ